jgi:segregation and condensation protein A
MVEHVKRLLHASPGPMRLEDLVGDYSWRRALIALFLAVLELVRLRAVLLRQLVLFAPITVAKSRRFEEILAATTPQELTADLEENLS